MNRSEIELLGLFETARFGEAIGTAARAGDIILLNGDLGAGKTTLTKSIGNALGLSADTITSPTFTLVHEHIAESLSLIHFDLYRLARPDDLDNLGFDDYLNGEGSFLVIEWASKAEGRLPEDALSIFLSFDEKRPSVRRANVQANGASSAGLLEKIMSAFNC